MNNDTAEQVFTRLGWAIDRRDWHAVRDVLAATIAVDYTELFGGEPASMSREDLTEQWRANLERLDATQHLIANVQASVNDDATVHATANVVATHVRAGTRAGRYGRSAAGMTLSSLPATTDTPSRALSCTPPGKREISQS